MKINVARTFWTVLIAGSITLLLPVSVFFLCRMYMSRLITQDNAGIMLDEFQIALDKGATIHDPAEATMVAERAYREKTSSVPIDGWGRRVKIAAEVHSNSCLISVQSAGHDGVMGNDDDVWVRRSFDLSRKTAASGIAGQH